MIDHRLCEGMTLAGASRQELVNEDKKACVAMLFSMMKLQRARNRDVFPGSNPVSIERAMIPRLTAEDYRAAAKSDGERFLLMAVTLRKVKLCVVVDRAMRMFIAPGCLPTMAFENSLIDGELVCSPAGAWTFMVFDCVYLSGLDISTHPFAYRLQLVEHWLLDIGDGLAGIGVKVKRFACVGRERLHREEGMPEDGIIFVPNNRPYVCYKNEHLLKWKANQAHTVDFRVTDGKLCVLSKSKLVEKDRVHPEDRAAEGSIVECQLVQGCWRVVKARHDKTMPNDLFVFQKTVLNIQEDIQRGELLV